MKIDIAPIIEEASGNDAIVMHYRNLDTLYFVRFRNGNRYTSGWTDKELLDFVPNKTVSEMIEAWEKSITKRYQEALKVVDTGNHPSWVRWDEDGNEIPYKVNVDGWTIIVDRLKRELEPLEFVKLVLPEPLPNMQSAII